MQSQEDLGIDRHSPDKIKDIVMSDLKVLEDYLGCL